MRKRAIETEERKVDATTSIYQAPKHRPKERPKRIRKTPEYVGEFMNKWKPFFFDC